jgi:hypothetical protein
VDASMRHGFPPARSVKRFSLLKDLQILHGGKSGGGYNFPRTLYHGMVLKDPRFHHQDWRGTNNYPPPEPLKC